ncbi:GntR family transcriptional regulator [Cryobacterium ruanii]|uniref:GntR family transcriptional regulator n=1 Tax=Cryobacterium ruanii TaxID=1259197 RepID=A0A4R9AQE4_9MICO|nr:GntR family transcriptional regulator [Cryobacterium ruanii]TFD67735.1 GntR family transcriptional regulator [Cryobacterium ruanii]
MWVPAQRDSDIAYATLQDMIVDLRLPPSTFINESALASELGLGRVPVREALARLAKDRFVTIMPRRGTAVTPLTLPDVLDIFEARETIECGVAYIAAARASEEDLAALRTLVETVDRDRESTDYEQFLLDDHAVHVRLVHIVQNVLLQDAADRLLLHSLRFWRMHWKNRPPSKDAMLSHADLLSALESRDPSRAEAAMRDHLTTSRQLVQILF